MPSNKKKKRAALNTSRGFSTVSVPSKPKPETYQESEVLNPSSQNSIVQIDNPEETIRHGSVLDNSLPFNVVDEDELNKLLEANDDLQLMIEHEKPKVQKELFRFMSKVRADNRLLRKQSMPLYLRDLLQDCLLERILFQARDESIQLDGSLDSSNVISTMGIDDITVRLWTLRQVLQDIGWRLSDGSSYNSSRTLVLHICGASAR
jgi:ATP-dependent RNA helicase DHX29